MGSPMENNQVTVVDVKMPFTSMVVFMVKWSLAALPAMLILILIGVMFAGFLSGFVSEAMK
jgi:hypothetical protein